MGVEVPQGDGGGCGDDSSRDSSLIAVPVTKNNTHSEQNIDVDNLTSSRRASARAAALPRQTSQAAFVRTLKKYKVILM